MNLICINCPKGCHLSIENIDGKFVVTGNSCPRGEKYAIEEMSNPVRTLTTTLKINSIKYERLPVISSKPLPKDKIMDAMKALKGIEVNAPIKLGDAVVKNILDLDVDILASKSILK